MKLFFVLIILFQIVLYASFESLTPKKLQELSKKGLVIIDIRTEKEWNKTGIIPRSYKMTFFDYQGKSNKKRWTYILARVVKDKKTSFVLISNNEKRSKNVAKLLSDELGYRRVYYLKNGIDNWIAQKKKVLNY